MSGPEPKGALASKGFGRNSEIRPCTRFTGCWESSQLGVMPLFTYESDAMATRMPFTNCLLLASGRHLALYVQDTYYILGRIMEDIVMK